MDPSQSDLEAIRRILAELTARIYRIEQRLGMNADVGTSAFGRPPAPSAAVPSATTAPPPPPLHPPPPPPLRPASHAEPQPDLESRIGSHWLNRIGIAALLIGISYFLKFAFDNNW